MYVRNDKWLQQSGRKNILERVHLGDIGVDKRILQCKPEENGEWSWIEFS